MGLDGDDGAIPSPLLVLGATTGGVVGARPAVGASSSSSSISLLGGRDVGFSLGTLVGVSVGRVGVEGGVVTTMVVGMGAFVTAAPGGTVVGGVEDGAVGATMGAGVGTRQEGEEQFPKITKETV